MKAHGTLAALFATMLDRESEPRLPAPFAARSQREIALLREVIAMQSELAAVEAKIDQVMQVVVERARRLLGAGSAVVELVDGESIVQRAVAGAAPHPVGTRIPIVGSLSGLCLRAGISLVSPDTDVDSRVDPFACRGVNARSIVVVPLRNKGETIGVLKLTADRRGAFDEHDSSVLELLGNAIASAVQRADSERAVREAEELLRLAIDDAPVATAIMSLDGRYLRVNRVFCELVGYSSTEIESFDFRTLGHPEDIAVGCDLLRKMVSGELSRCEYEKRYVHKSGRVVSTLIRGSVAHDLEGRPRCFVSQIEDVSAQRDLQTRLAIAERMASVGTLAAGIAHEINNPLATLMLDVEQLQEEMAPGELRDIVDEVATSAERVRRIVRGLKVFARADEQTRVPVDVTHVLDAAVTLSRNELRHRARFAADFRPVPLVEADEGRLTQVFLNLLANAAHAIPLGQADRHRICARTYTDEDGHAVMEIEDSGAGIPEAIKSRVFDPFFTTKPVGQGSGLGLSICHGIIQSMGGEIGFESEPGRGTTFRVRLPPAQQQTPERRSSGSMKIAASVARARVLVVDDEAAIGRAVARALSPHAVDVVSSAHHALRKIETTDYDVVLTDVMMPQTSGIELFERLRERGDDLSHRVVFMTGGTFDQRMQDALESLPNRKLEKPIAIEKLRNVVADLRARRSTRG